MEEQKLKEKEEEDRRNQEFERNNPEFCTNFVKDMNERRKAQEKKAETAEVLRLKGNKFFKAKDFEAALAHYMDALKHTPFDSKLLLNIAQAAIKLRQLPDALEFLRRTLFLDDGRNVKALSRQAFVLSELGQYDEALQAVTAALALDASNEELLAQRKEIAAMQAEAAQEKLLQQSADHPADAEAEAAVALTGRQQVEDFAALLLRFPAVEAAALLADDQKAADFAKALAALLQQAPGVRESLRGQSLLLVLFRQLNGLQALLHWIRLLPALAAAWPTLLAPHLPATVTYETALAQLIGLANVALDEKRAGKTLFLEAKLYGLYKELLAASMAETALPLQAAVLECFWLLAKDEIVLKTKQLLFADPKLFPLLGQLAGNVLSNFIAGRYSAAAQLAHLREVLAILTHLAALAKEFFFSPHEADKALARGLDAAAGLQLVYSFGLGLHFLLHHATAGPAVRALAEQSAEKQQIRRDCLRALELLVDCFVGFSQLDGLKRFFADALPLPLPDQAAESKQNSDTPASSSVVSELLQAVTLFPQFAVNGLAVLMNASIEPAASATAKDTAQLVEAARKVKEAMTARPEGVALALSVLSWTDGLANPLLAVPPGQRLTDAANQSLVAEEDGLFYARKVGLLSRLISLPTIAATILADTRALPAPAPAKSKAGAVAQQRPWFQRGYFQQLCRNLFVLVRPNHGDNGLSREQEAAVLHQPKWQADLLLHFVRIAATLLSAQGKAVFADESLKKALVEEQLPATLLFLLPMPRQDCLEVTDRSVTLVPRFPAPALLLGNVVHALLQFLASGDAQLSRLFFQEILSPSGAGSGSGRFFTVEKAVCAMATCQDIRVRKNIAILLARACQLDAKVRERVSFFRGLQMIVELQKEL